MFSIIVCSINPKMLHELEDNIRLTIGCDYEIIAVDNREKCWPIAKVYNYGAERSRYPYLFFVHEDVVFYSSNWGKIIGDKLSEPDCGVIGFVGTKAMLKCYSGWYLRNEWTVSHFCQRDTAMNKAFWNVSNAYLDVPFEEVVALDGFGLFVKKQIWVNNPFDEKLLTGFHCYDVDFSLHVARKYKNYVCTAYEVVVEHVSKGSLNEEWYKSTIELYQSKWKYLLPMSVEGMNLNPVKVKLEEERQYYNFLCKIMKYNLEKKRIVLNEFWNLPFTWKHFRHCVACTMKYLKSW